jgi:hypothetical protein
VPREPKSMEKIPSATSEILYFLSIFEVWKWFLTSSCYSSQMGSGYLQPCITYIDIGEVPGVAKATIHQEQGIGHANSLNSSTSKTVILVAPSVSCQMSDSFPCSLSILDGTEVWRYHQTNNSPRNGVSRCCFSVSLVDFVLWWQRVEQ